MTPTSQIRWLESFETPKEPPKLIQWFTDKDGAGEWREVETVYSWNISTVDNPKEEDAN